MAFLRSREGPCVEADGLRCFDNGSSSAKDWRLLFAKRDCLPTSPRDAGYLERPWRLIFLAGRCAVCVNTGSRQSAVGSRKSFDGFPFAIRHSPFAPHTGPSEFLCSPRNCGVGSREFLPHHTQTTSLELIGCWIRQPPDKRPGHSMGMETRSDLQSRLR